jgi:hypothetical protein
MIMRKTSSLTEIFLYTENGADVFNVIAFNAISASQGNLLFINAVRSNIVVMSFSFLASG